MKNQHLAGYDTLPEPRASDFGCTGLMLILLLLGFGGAAAATIYFPSFGFRHNSEDALLTDSEPSHECEHGGGE